MSDAFRRRLFLWTLAAFALRAAFLLLEPHTQPVADERTWTNWAIENLLSEKVRLNPLRTNMIFYPPLYPYFIALPYLLFGSLAAVKWTQVLVSAALVPALGRVSAGVFGERVGTLTAAVVAVYPELIWFSAHFWSETLFMLFLWWAFERFLKSDAESSLGPAAAAGLLWGLSILVRETALYFTPLAALWLGWRRPRGLARGLLFLVLALGVVAPWTWRNWNQFHAFVPVSTAGGLNLFQGNARLTRQEVYDRYEAVHGRIEQYRFARQAGIEAILERQPWWIFEKLRDEMPKFWESDSLALIHLKRGAYGSVDPEVAQLAWAVLSTPFVLAVALFVLGCAALPLDRRTLLLLSFLIFYNGLHLATHGFARYRLPVLPVVLMIAAFAVELLRTSSWRELSATRRAVALALAFVAVVTVWPSLELNARHPAFGLSDNWDAAEEEAPAP